MEYAAAWLIGAALFALGWCLSTLTTEERMPRSLKDEIEAMRKTVRRWSEDQEDRAKEFLSQLDELEERVKNAEKPPKGEDDD